MLTSTSVRAYFDRTAVSYHEQFYLSGAPDSVFWVRHRYILEMVGTAALGPHPLVLDVGCGPGEMVRALAELGCRVWGLDAAEQMVRVAGRVLADRRLHGPVGLAIGDAEWLPFKDGMFDLVICAGVFEYLACDEAALMEIRRTLSPGGYLIVNVTNRYSYLGLLDPAMHALKMVPPLRRLGQLLKGRVLGRGALHVFPFRPRRHAPRTFEHLLSASGFTKERGRFFNFGPLPRPLGTLFWFATEPVARWMERLAGGRWWERLGDGYLVMVRKARGNGGISG